MIIYLEKQALIVSSLLTLSHKVSNTKVTKCTHQNSSKKYDLLVNKIIEP